MNTLPCPHCSTELKVDEDYHFCSKCGFIVRTEWLQQAHDYYVQLFTSHKKSKFKVPLEEQNLGKVYSTSINSLGVQK